MGRPRKPTHLHEVTGSYVKNPGRRNNGEPVPREGIGTAPERLSTDFSEAWDELVANACPGVLGNSDRLWIEITARLLCEYREAPESMTGVRIGLLLSGLSKLGMSPSDRTRLQVKPGETERPEDAYF